MATLLHAQCTDFLRYFYPELLSTGLVEPIREFAAREPGGLCNALNSWLAAMTAGQTPNEALASMKPRFPVSVEEILRLGCQSGALDYAVADINDIYAQHETEAEREAALARLLAEYRKRTTATGVCQHCVERELEKLLRRAKCENASEVVLEQEGDRQIHELFMSVKVVRMSEPSRAAVYAALVRRLESGKPLLIEGIEICVAGGKGGPFSLTWPSGALRVRCQSR